MQTSDDKELRDALKKLLCADEFRMRLLHAVESLRLPDCWIGAGFVRAAVWDHSHGRHMSAFDGDVDVVWFDRARSVEIDRATETELAAKEPSFRWSVKNQAWMHVRNGELPYESTEDAVRRWPETATAIAVRLSRSELEILAPFGLSDLFSMIVRPTPAFVGDKFPFFIERVRNKRWLERWPMLSLAEVTGRPE